MALVAVAFVVLAGRPATPEFPSRALVAELAGLKMDNGLFARPGLSEYGAPSLYATAYALPVMRAAGVEPPTRWDPAATWSMAEAAIAADPLWTRWYVLHVEAATGEQLPGPWADGVTKLFDDKGGLDVGSAVGPERDAAEIAMTAAALEIADAKSVALGADLTRVLTIRLRDAADRLPSPYLRCLATRSLRLLGVDLAADKGLDRVASRPSSIGSLEDLLDLYGVVCLDNEFHDVLSNEARAQIREQLRPLLDVRDKAADLEAYYVARTWIAAGGAPADLRPMASRLLTRVDPKTGLIVEEVLRLGTLDTTYQVSRITNEAFAGMAGDATVTAVRAGLPRLREAGDVTSLLMSAVVLRRANHPDPALEAEAADLFAARTAGFLGRDDVGWLTQGLYLMDELGESPAKVRVTPFDAASREDRLLAWRLLSQTVHISNADEVSRFYRPVIEALPAALRDPNELLVREVHSGVLALMAHGSAGGVPWDELDRWALSLRGCGGFSELYRPALSADACAVDSTAELLLVDLGPQTGTRLRSGN